ELTYRARPFVALHFVPLYPHPPNNSFPSSLTAFAAVAAVVGVLAWGRLGLVFVLGMVVVGFGCVYVGVHYATDVIAGAGIGAACGAVTWLVAGLPPIARALRALERRLPPGRRYRNAGRVSARAAS
ncbi:MAG: phosphatase PAP2 family protein, partial [Candidatus Dormiibacterota bacterium]